MKIFTKEMQSTTPTLGDLFQNYGFITEISSGIAKAKGLYKVRSGELVRIYPQI